MMLEKGMVMEKKELFGKKHFPKETNRLMFEYIYPTNLEQKKKKNRASKIVKGKCRFLVEV